MELQNFDRLLETAERYFTQRNYEQAFMFYALAKEEKPESPEVEVGILLTSLAGEQEEEAQAIFEFYSAARSTDESGAIQMVKTLIESVETGLESAGENMVIALEEQVEREDGIQYKDFQRLVREAHDFKEIFQKVIFSTKVIITQKNDFFSFVEALIDNGYIEMALGYIDSANNVFPSDLRIRELLEKIQRIEQRETPRKH